MEQAKMVPVRDTGPMRPGKNVTGDDRVVAEHQSSQHRRMVSTWDRGEIEDRYLRLYEDHIYLKKHCHKQEDRLKRLGTKVMQLAVDRRKEATNGNVKITGGSSMASVKINELETKIYELERQNAQLKEKLKLTKQQLLLASKQPSAYNHIQSRINTGIVKAVSDQRLVKNRRVMGPHVNGHEQRIMHDTESAALMENLVIERLQEEIEGLKKQIFMYQEEVEELHEQNKMKEADFEENIIKLQQQMSADQRVNVEENIELIRLQRQVKEKSNDLVNLQIKYQKIEENLRTMKHSHESVLVEMDRLNLQIKDEQNKKLTLQQDLKIAAAKNALVIELQEQIAGLQNDKQLLVDSNEKLTRSAFDMQREREWRQRECALKVQLAQLEATLKADLGEKGNVIDRLNTEIAEHEAAEQKLKEVRIEYFQLKEEYDDLKNKMSFFTDKSSVDLIELEEALMLVRSKHQDVNKVPEFVQKVDAEIDKATNQRVQQLESEFAETVHELEKTRNMLILQHKINKDYQKEVDDAHHKLENMQRECDLKLSEYASLLDIRAARIKKLESQLRDVAYGTKQIKLNMSTEQDKSELDESIQLERGKNLFEIHIHKVNLSSDGLKALGDNDVALFCTWEFYEFEIQATPVVHGVTPEFDFTSQYIVTVDDFFLHYIQKETCTLELQLSFGQSFKTLAACQLRFHDLFDHPPGRIHCTAFLTGVDMNNPGNGFGTVEYWINLRVPMEQALRLYKERTKALGYINANNQSTMKALKALDEVAAMRPADNINQLHIKIIRCIGLQAHRKDVQPSPYCVYQFFDYGDHDSIILHSTNNPEFNDHHTYPVAMTTTLDQYIRSSDLKIFVFDDTDPTESSFLCMANIPLVSLVHENDVRGLFELRRTDNTVNGQIEVALYWQDTYLPPLAAPLQIPSQIPTIPTEITDPPLAMPFDDGHMPSSSSNSSKTLARTSSPKPIETISGSGALTTDFETVSSLSTSKAMSSQISTSAPFQNKPLMTSTPAIHSVVTTVANNKEVRVSSSQNQQQQQLDSSVQPKQQQSMHQYVMSPRAAPRKLKFATEKKPSCESVADIEPLEKSFNKQEMVLKDQKVKVEETHVPQQNNEIIEEEIEESLIEETLPESKQISSLFQQQQQLAPQSNKMVENEDSDSEGLIIPTEKDSKSSTLKDKEGDTVTVVISHLTLEVDSKPVKNENVKQLYVEYRFLNYPPEELETPYPLPKPKNGLPVNYHFSKCFHVDYQNNYDKRQFLASMLLPNDPDEGRIRFTIVSEPEKEAQGEECEEVGVAYVRLLDILRNNKDVIDEDIIIYDVEDERTVIGSLNISIICLAALRAVDQEIVRE